MKTSPFPAQITLFGGTFDPVHLGHLDLAKRLADKYHLENCYLVPTRQNPLKKNGPEAPAIHRLEMLRLALEELGDSRMHILDWEAKSEEPSYTVGTVEKLRAVGVKRITLLLGDEVFAGMPHWKNPKKLLSYVDLLVATRSASGIPEVARTLRECGIDDARPTSDSERFVHSDGERWVQIAIIEALPFSSTAMRREATQATPDAVPSGISSIVWNYIKKNGLYSVKER